MKYPLLSFLLLLAAGCTAGGGRHEAPREITMVGARAGCCQIKDDDTEMAGAVTRARRTEGKFIAALEHPTASQRNFEVKKPFIYQGTLEHIWLSDVSYHRGHFHGKVDNHPEHIPDVKLGDRVSVNANEITDWSYVDKDRLVGGYTIRVLFKDLSPEDQKAFAAREKYHFTKL